MNKAIEALFQSIGNQIMDIAGDTAPMAIAYVEAEDGVVSVSVFYSYAQGGLPVFKFGGPILSELFHSLWLEWRKENDGIAWRAVTYIINDGRANLEMMYPDKFDESVNKLARRSSMVKRYFGTEKADYSRS